MGSVTVAEIRSGASPGASGGARAAQELDVDLLLYFYAVADSLSFTRAAQRLGLDQSWLSHKIRQFEGSIGAKLFIRNTRNVELTAAGQALLEPARRLTQVAWEARQATEMLRRNLGGTLRVGALPFSFPDRQRAALLDRFMGENPDVRVDVLNGPSPQLLARLRAGEIDLAFASGPFESAGLDALLLRKTSFCLMMPDDHPLAANAAIHAADLQGVKLVLPSAHFSPAAYDTYYRPVVEAGIVPAPAPEFQCAVTYANHWGLPVMCTRQAAERHLAPGVVLRNLDFVPECEKYLVRLASHRTPSQIRLWEIAQAATAADAGA